MKSFPLSCDRESNGKRGFPSAALLRDKCYGLHQDSILAHYLASILSKMREAPVMKWESHDSSGYADWSQAERVRFANLKPSIQAISLRLPPDLLEQIKIAAHKRNVPFVWVGQDSMSKVGAIADA